MNIIQVSKEDFAKISKRLSKQFKSTQSETLSLSKTQEQLAIAFGFRNYNSINTFFTKEDKGQKILNHVEKKISTERVISHDLNEEQFILIFKNFVYKNKIDGWTTKAITLIEAIIPALIYMREQKEIILDFVAIKNYLIFDNVFNLYKARRDFPTEIRHLLRDYLFSLPSFQESAPKQNDTVLEHHGYLQMQFQSALHSLIKIDKQIIPILPQAIVSLFTSTDKHHSYRMAMVRPEIKIITEQWEGWENSNFLSEQIVNLILANKIALQGKSLFLHDLIQLSFNYMNEKKRYDLFDLLSDFINNLSLTKRYSSEVIAIFDK